MIYYDSRILSQRLKINPAKWKRWARAFLPPDPLGGLQSGFARQFSLKDAFKVYLGGYLVGELKFAIPDAQQILNDLSSWLRASGFFSIAHAHQEHHLENHYIYICPMLKHRFSYCVRTILSLSADDAHRHQEIYLLSLISTDHDLIASGEAQSASLLAITTIYNHFLSHLG
jgi:hypothetical protein